MMLWPPALLVPALPCLSTAAVCALLDCAVATAGTLKSASREASMAPGNERRRTSSWCMCVGPGYQSLAIRWSILAPRPQRRSLFIHRQPWHGQGSGAARGLGRAELLRALVSVAKDVAQDVG